jgi:hypothetical protein
MYEYQFISVHINQSSYSLYYCAFPQLLPTFTTLRPVIAIWVYLTMLAPMVQDLGAVYSDLCGGHLGFVWSVDKRHVVHFARTQGDVSDLSWGGN